jgi:hypothetical protein
MVHQQTQVANSRSSDNDFVGMLFSSQFFTTQIIVFLAKMLYEASTLCIRGLKHVLRSWALIDSMHFSDVRHRVYGLQLDICTLSQHFAYHLKTPYILSVWRY